jgi:thiol:disulfide interchange protein
MERVILEWLDNTTFPFVTAILLGLLTAISPCPLATNITAMGYIGKDIENRRKVFYNGLWYTLGTIASYSFLASIIYLGADQFDISGIFQRYGEKIIGPLLLFIGLAMLGIFKIPFPRFMFFTRYLKEKGANTSFDSFLLGVILALAFCPNTGVMYFGMLVPLTINTPSGLYLPVVFAVTSAIPVVLFAYFIAFALNSVGVLYGKITILEKWFRKAVSIGFILAALLLIYKVYF